ncbi:MAG: hypothetical protein JXJ22_09935 [Bacteroidales bacterium]|nr:hypothetical protein [Bacteroidales bacterium]
MRNIIHLCLALIIFSIQFSFGQKEYKPGYIISNNNDTISGFINLKSNYSNSLECDFKKTKEEKPLIYSPDEISGYRIENSKFYVSREVKIDSLKTRVFLEYLVDGIVDLYYYRELTREFYFIEKDSVLIQLSNEEVEREINGVSMVGNSNQYIRMLNYLFSDSPEITRDLRNAEFGYKPLINLTKNYHNAVCKDYDCIDYTKSTRSNIYIEGFLGGGVSWMGFKYSEDYLQTINPNMGIMFRFMPLRMFHKWNLLTGFNYSRNNFEGEILDEKDYVSRDYDILANYSYISFPFIIEYCFVSSKIQPIISFGLNNVIIFNENHRIKAGRYDIESVFRKYQYGIAFGAGVKYHFSNFNYLFIKNDFEYRLPSANLGHFFDLHHVISSTVNVGYGLKLK